MAVKRAERRLVRLPDGTIGVKYFDLDTLQEVLDLTGYIVVSSSQPNPEKPASNDNSDDKEVEINPPSEGSSTGVKGADGDRAEYISGQSKNPAINEYLKNFPPAPTGTAQPREVDDTIGGVTVTPDKDIANSEWESVEEGTGNTVVANPNNPSQTQVFTSLDQTKFDQNLRELSTPVADMPKNAQYTSEQERVLANRRELENIKDASLGTGLYTAAQRNIEIGAAPDMSPLSGASRSTAGKVKQEAVSGASRSTAGKVSSLSGASRSTAGKVSTQSPLSGASRGIGAMSPQSGAAQSGTAGKVQPDAAPRGAVNAGIMSQDSYKSSVPGGGFGLIDAGLQKMDDRRESLMNQKDSSLGTGIGAAAVSNSVGIGSDAVAGKTSTDLGTQPDSSRFGASLNEQIAKGVSQTSPLGEIEMASGINTRSSFPTSRPGVPGSLPAAKPGGITQPSPIGAPSKGLGDIYGDRPSTAQKTIDQAADVTRSYGPNTGIAARGFNNPTRSKTTSFVDPAGYSKTDVTGNRGWRNNNPGNLVASSWTQSQPGYIGTDGRFGIFDSVEAGRKAQAALLGTKNYQTLTLSQAVSRYAPEFENNTTAYTQAIADALGVPTNTPMRDLTPAQREAMISAMHEVEGSNTFGTSSTSLTQKGIDARDNYTGIGTGSDTPSERNASSRPSPGGVPGANRVASGVGGRDTPTGTFGTSSSPGVGRSSIGVSAGERSGSDRGGTSSAGPGRGSSSGGGIGNAAGAGAGRGSSPGGQSIGGTRSGSAGNNSGTSVGRNAGMADREKN